MKTYAELEAIGITDKVNDDGTLLVYCSDFTVYEFDPETQKFNLVFDLKA